MNYFPDEVIEHVFDYVVSHRDRNALSLVCKSWYRIERCTRQKVFIGNCYSISPERLIQRFPSLKSLTLKGKPHFADFSLVPYGWGGFVYPWIEALAKGRVGLEELRLKRMVVSDESLELLSRSFMNFKSLVLVSCEGFTTDGLAAVAANCRWGSTCLLGWSCVCWCFFFVTCLDLKCLLENLFVFVLIWCFGGRVLSVQFWLFHVVCFGRCTVECIVQLVNLVLSLSCTAKILICFWIFVGWWLACIFSVGEKEFT